MEMEKQEQLKRVSETVPNRRSVEGKMLCLEKYGIAASLRISKYLWIRSDKVYSNLPASTGEKIQEDDTSIA